MEKSIFEQMGGAYRKEGDHLLGSNTTPGLTLMSEVDLAEGER